MTPKRAGTKGVPRLDRENQIVLEATEEFGTRGYAATSIETIAARAGISKPLVYNYFGSKEGLYTACLDRAGTIVADEIERIAAGDAVGIERGMRTLAGIFDILEPQRHLWRLFFDSTAPTTGPVAAAKAHYLERIGKLADEGVSEMMALAGNRDPQDIAAMTSLWLGVVDSLVNWWLDHADQTAAQMTERCNRLLQALWAATAR
jgi:AcrR family transcriptional regulator